jgi:hypothetical protein
MGVNERSIASALIDGISSDLWLIGLPSLPPDGRFGSASSASAAAALRATNSFIPYETVTLR